MRTIQEITGMEPLKWYKMYPAERKEFLRQKANCEGSIPVCDTDKLLIIKNKPQTIQELDYCVAYLTYVHSMYENLIPDVYCPEELFLTCLLFHSTNSYNVFTGNVGWKLDIYHKNYVYCAICRKDYYYEWEKWLSILRKVTIQYIKDKISKFVLKCRGKFNTKE